LATMLHPLGYAKGRKDGYERGLQDGREQARKDLAALRASRSGSANAVAGAATSAAQANPPQEINGRYIAETCEKLGVFRRFRELFGPPGTLHGDAACLKDSFKSSIWLLNIAGKAGRKPVVLKIFKPASSPSSLNEIEKNMYVHGSKVLGEFMPAVYSVHPDVHGGSTWVFMEFVPPVKGRVDFSPKHFDNIIPALARMHAVTHNERFFRFDETLMPWMPMYHSAEFYAQRLQAVESLNESLTKAMNHPELKDMLAADYAYLKRCLRKGPDYFPELTESGQSVIHNDLQTVNMGCEQVKENEPWAIRFLDWEGARYAPCWFDLVNLVAVFLTYRSEWRQEEDDIFAHTANLYAHEMGKHGITFGIDPLTLFKMAYVQRTFEKSLAMHLNWAMQGRSKGAIVTNTVARLTRWCKELGLA